MTDTAAEIRVPVLIVGGGPVGLIQSMDIARRGIKCLLVNEGDSTINHPKGSSINCRTMEHIRRLGMADDIRKTGVPLDHPSDVIYVTRMAGYELARLKMPTLREKIENPGPWGETLIMPEPMHRSNQMYFETVFKDHADREENSDLRYGWRLKAFEDRDDHVWAEIEEVASGRIETVICDYLIGCDGSRSMVRRQLGFTYQGRSSSGDSFYDGAMLSVYIRAPAAYDVLNMDVGWHYLSINGDGRTDCITLDGEGDFLMLSEMPKGKTADEVDCAAQFRDAVGADIPIEVVSAREWLGGLALTTDGYQKGRVFLAGDSVHLFTPSGGFGFNTGIDDAVNLAWKICAVLNGWGGQGLLDSYEGERRPIGIRNTSESGRLAEQIGTLKYPDNIEDADAAGDAVREEFQVELMKRFKEEFASLGIQLGARYDGSPLIVSDGTSPPPDDPAVYIPSACPGGRTPHYWIGKTESLYDKLGPEFTLLRLGSNPPDAAALVSVAEERGIPLAVLDVAEEGIRNLYEADLALIRPDQHVAWRGNDLSDPAALMAAVTGNA